METLKCIYLVFVKYYLYYMDKAHHNLISVCFIILSLFPAMFHLLHKPYSLDTIIVLTFSEHNTIHELA